MDNEEVHNTNPFTWYIHDKRFLIMDNTLFQALTFTAQIVDLKRLIDKEEPLTSEELDTCQPDSVWKQLRT